MAKIKEVTLINVPDVIVIGDNHSDLTAIIDIEFHDIDVKLQMEYMLYILVYDVHGKADIPIILNNWDESVMFPIALNDSSDDFLGTYKTRIIAEENTFTFKKDIALKLGVLNRHKTHNTKKLEALAFLVPAISRVSKWSKPYSAVIEF